MKESLNSVYSSDQYMKNQERSVLKALVLGVVFLLLYFLFEFGIFNYEGDLTGVLYIGLFLTGFSILALVLKKLSHNKNKILYYIEDDAFVISPSNKSREVKYLLEDYIVKGKIYTSNLGMTKTCTLILENRNGKKKRINCALDQNSFEQLLSELVSL